MHGTRDIKSSTNYSYSLDLVSIKGGDSKLYIGFRGIRKGLLGLRHDYFELERTNRETLDP